MKTNNKSKNPRPVKLKIFTLICNADPLDTFDVEAKNVDDAAHVALDKLGWWITKD
jgi:hypothetical protein